MINILIVDDQPSIRQLLSEELAQEGYETSLAACGESAMRCLALSQPDLVVLDLYLDGPMGWDVLDEIKRYDQFLPVIIFTAYDSFVEDPRLAKAESYVVKSADLTELKKNIAQILAEGDKFFSRRRASC